MGCYLDSIKRHVHEASLEGRGLIEGLLGLVSLSPLTRKDRMKKLRQHRLEA